MTKQKITLSLDSKIAEKLRSQAFKKYGNFRSLSKMIEDLATGAAEAKKPEVCSILGHRSEMSIKSEEQFKKDVEEIRAKLKEIKVFHNINDKGKPLNIQLSSKEMYFTLKEACELEINRYADVLNECWGCAELNGPVPIYPDAGRNFEVWALLESKMR
jgi:hypothetical protein